MREITPYEVVRQSWRPRPWVVVVNYSVGVWGYVSFHASEASARAKVESLRA